MWRYAQFQLPSIGCVSSWPITSRRCAYTALTTSSSWVQKYVGIVLSMLFLLLFCYHFLVSCKQHNHHRFHTSMRTYACYTIYPGEGLTTLSAAFKLCVWPFHLALCPGVLVFVILCALVRKHLKEAFHFLPIRTSFYKLDFFMFPKAFSFAVVVSVVYLLFDPAAAMKHRKDGVMLDLVTQLLAETFRPCAKGRFLYTAPYCPCSNCILLAHSLCHINSWGHTQPHSAAAMMHNVRVLNSQHISSLVQHAISDIALCLNIVAVSRLEVPVFWGCVRMCVWVTKAPLGERF